jgi:acyl-CoA dehydrogenase
MQSYHIGLADGPIEVHKATLAKQMLRDYQPSQSLFPDYHLPIRREQAIEKFRAALDKIGQ